MKVLVINGPNINLLGLREPELYGSMDYYGLISMIKGEADAMGIEVEFTQSNHEGILVDTVQKAYKKFDGIILNPAAYTHSSIALLDALKAVALPAVEVHITDPDTREEFRRRSYIRSACIATVKGKGVAGYLEALHLLVDYLNK